MEKKLKGILRLWFPALCIIGGTIILIAAVGPNNQNGSVMLGAAAILIVGVVSLLYLLDKVNKPLRLVFTVLFALGAAYMVFANWTSINSEIEYKKKATLVKAETIQALKDIRSAEEAYVKVNGLYTQDLDELVNFVKTGKLPELKKIGAIPDSIGSEEKARELGMVIKMPEGMTDAQVKAAGLIVRDTVYIPVMESAFTNDIAMAARKFPFDVDKMVYAPNSGKKWIAEATTRMIGGVTKPVLKITDPEPFDNSEALTIGSLEDAHLNGNWKED
ncbi:MAG: hypothetical protein O2867_06635 [Bacteroidetes bacterium]|jgi:hypothetical protein|nr:hypothetical protein [Bacteroidota bacterium]MDA0973391.1 hypothetical protein [Bacteroidota bacterium]